MWLLVALITSSVAAFESPGVSSQRLPTVIVDAYGQQITNRQRWPVSIIVGSGNATERSRAEMSVRGSSSARREKKPYRLELQDENGEDMKLSLLGMPKESDWILYPAYTDKTMIRDVLAYELWRQMGYWAPRTRYVHLFIFTNSVPSDFASIGVFSGQSPGSESGPAARKLPSEGGSSISNSAPSVPSVLNSTNSETSAFSLQSPLLRSLRSLP